MSSWCGTIYSHKSQHLLHIVSSTWIRNILFLSSRAILLEDQDCVLLNGPRSWMISSLLLGPWTSTSRLTTEALPKVVIWLRSSPSHWWVRRSSLIRLLKCQLFCSAEVLPSWSAYLAPSLLVPMSPLKHRLSSISNSLWIWAHAPRQSKYIIVPVLFETNQLTFHW